MDILPFPPHFLFEKKTRHSRNRARSYYYDRRKKALRQLPATDQRTSRPANELASRALAGGGYSSTRSTHASYASAIYAQRSDVTTPTHCADQRTLACVRAVRPNPPSPPSLRACKNKYSKTCYYILVLCLVKGRIVVRSYPDHPN